MNCLWIHQSNSLLWNQSNSFLSNQSNSLLWNHSPRWFRQPFLLRRTSPLDSPSGLLPSHWTAFCSHLISPYLTYQEINDFLILANRRIVQRTHSLIIAERKVRMTIYQLSDDRYVVTIAGPVQHSRFHATARSYVRPSASDELIWSGCCLMKSSTSSVSPSAIFPKISSASGCSSLPSSSLFHISWRLLPTHASLCSLSFRNSHQ